MAVGTEEGNIDMRRKRMLYEMQKIDRKLDRIINHFKIPFYYKSLKTGIKPKNLQKNKKPNKR